MKSEDIMFGAVILACVGLYVLMVAVLRQVGG